MKKDNQFINAYIVLLLTIMINPFVTAEDMSFDETAQSSSTAQGQNRSFDIVHPCTDYGFKRAFHEQNVACGFINTILKLHGTNAITNVRFLDKELPSHEMLGRFFIVDILCETGKGDRFLIEMQNDFRSDYATKAFTEFCRLIAHWDTEVIHQEVAEDTRKRARANATYEGVKEFWKNIKTAIVLIITNKRFPAEQQKVLLPEHSVMEPDIINTYRMMHENGTGRPLGDLDARVVLVMLGNFNKAEDELVTPLDQWLYAFKDDTLASGVSRIPIYKHINDAHCVGVTENSGIAAFYHILDKDVVRNAGDLDTFEKDIAEVNGMLELRDDKKRLEGLTEGLAKGLAEGIIKQQCELLQKKRAKGKSNEVIISEMEINADQLVAIEAALQHFVQFGTYLN